MVHTLLRVTKDEAKQDRLRGSACRVLNLSDFKMDLIKWQLKFRLCNFGLKSYFGFKLNSRCALACSAGSFGGFHLSSVKPPFWIRWRLRELG